MSNTTYIKEVIANQLAFIPSVEKSECIKDLIIFLANMQHDEIVDMDSYEDDY